MAQQKKWMPAQSGISRRRIIAGLAATGLLAAPPFLYRATAARAFSEYPFQLGVASGDPGSDSVVLWTRLAPHALSERSMPAVEVPVVWELAGDESMRTIVQKGVVMARPESAHSVHVEVRGLEPDRWYWYRFRAGTEASPVGRTCTLPAPGKPLDKFKLAFASCQHYEQGLFTAHRHLSEEDIRLVVFLGDYIYETKARAGYTRMHNGDEAITLDGYRKRYALYKMDPHLQAAHAAFPWIATTDDHEVINDYAGDVDRKRRTSRKSFLRRRAAAYQAYFEHLPLRAMCRPNGPGMRLYRRFALGSLAEINVLDTRQYRSIQPCGSYTEYKNASRCAQSLDPKNTILGAAQRAWLLDGLARSETRWQMIAQQVPMMQRLKPQVEGFRLNMDKWDGYAGERQLILDLLAKQQSLNPIVITGDVHSNWAGNLHQDFDNPNSAIVGAEFIGTSLASGGDGADMTKTGRRILGANPHIKFYNRQRGYVTCTLTRTNCEAAYRVVDYVSKPGAPIRTRATFPVEWGRRGLHPGQ
ncbi:MAG: hypothetical protein RLZ98_2381 [Pseudomonadota bacterium]|jgi:alkaline phosphatase D